MTGTAALGTRRYDAGVEPIHRCILHLCQPFVTVAGEILLALNDEDPRRRGQRVRASHARFLADLAAFIDAARVAMTQQLAEDLRRHSRLPAVRSTPTVRLAGSLREHSLHEYDEAAASIAAKIHRIGVVASPVAPIVAAMAGAAAGVVYERLRSERDDQRGGTSPVIAAVLAGAVVERLQFCQLEDVYQEVEQALWKRLDALPGVAQALLDEYITGMDGEHTNLASRNDALRSILEAVDHIVSELRWITRAAFCFRWAAVPPVRRSELLSSFTGAGSVTGGLGATAAAFGALRWFGVPPFQEARGSGDGDLALVGSTMLAAFMSYCFLTGAVEERELLRRHALADFEVNVHRLRLSAESLIGRASRSGTPLQLDARALSAHRAYRPRPGVVFDIRALIALVAGLVSLAVLSMVSA